MDYRRGKTTSTSSRYNNNVNRGSERRKPRPLRATPEISSQYSELTEMLTNRDPQTKKEPSSNRNRIPPNPSTNSSHYTTQRRGKPTPQNNTYSNIPQPRIHQTQRRRHPDRANENNNIDDEDPSYSHISQTTSARMRRNNPSSNLGGRSRSNSSSSYSTSKRRSNRPPSPSYSTQRRTFIPGDEDEEESNEDSMTNNMNFMTHQMNAYVLMKTKHRFGTPQKTSSSSSSSQPLRSTNRTSHKTYGPEQYQDEAPRSRRVPSSRETKERSYRSNDSTTTHRSGPKPSPRGRPRSAQRSKPSRAPRDERPPYENKSEEKEEEEEKEDLTASTPIPPQSNTDMFEKAAMNDARGDSGPGNLVPCSNCGRKFAADRIQKHESACKGQKKRKVFKVKRLDRESEQIAKRSKKQSNSKNKEEKSVKPQRKIPIWKARRAELLRALRSGNPQPQKDQVQVKAPQNSSTASGPLVDDDMGDLDQYDDRIECPHCGRKFNETAAERHIPRCTKIMAKPKMLKKGSGTTGGVKRPTNVSSRGVRRGRGGTSTRRRY